MLKSNSKKAKENIRRYILNNYDYEPYRGYTETAEPQTFAEVAAFILDTFRIEKYSRPQDYKYYHYNEFAAFADWAAGLPSALDCCYYYNRSAVDDLAEILEETDEEKAKYTEQQAEERLTSLIYRELIKGCVK